MLSLKIIGEPKPKQSARFFARGGKMVSYQTQEVMKTSESIQMQVLSQLPKDFEPFKKEVRIKKALFVFPPRKDFSKKKMKAIESGEIFYKSTKPDLTDNLMKGLMDSLESIIFVNDSQIVEVHSAKIYGLVPRTEITFEEIEKPE